MSLLTPQMAERQLRNSAIDIMSNEQLLRIIRSGCAYMADPSLGRGEFPVGAILSFEDEEGVVIGQGCYGQALLGMLEDATKVVIKLPTDASPAIRLDEVVHEACMLALDRHHDVFPALRGVCIDPPALVMDFVNRTSLQRVARNRRDGKPELYGPPLWYSTVSFLDVIGKLVNMGICHRDLKPDNILMGEKLAHSGTGSSYNVLLGDAGTAQLWTQPLRELRDGEGPQLGNMLAQTSEMWRELRLHPTSDLPAVGMVLVGLWLNVQSGISIYKPLSHQLSSLLLTLLATGGVPFTPGAVARGFIPTNIIHVVMLFLSMLSFAIMMSLDPAHRGTASIHRRLVAAVADVLLATKRDVPDIAVQRAALQALCLLVEPEIARLVPAHVRMACLNHYHQLSERLDRDVRMLQAGDATLVLSKVDVIQLQVSTMPLPSYLSVQEFAVALLGAPTLIVNPIYAGDFRPGWHSSGLLLFEEPQATLVYIFEPKRGCAPTDYSDKALEFTDWGLQHGLELAHRPILQLISQVAGSSESQRQAALKAVLPDGHERVPFTAWDAPNLGLIVRDVGGWMTQVYTGQAFHNQPVVGGPGAPAAVCHVLDRVAPMLRTQVGHGGDEKLGIEVRLAASTALRELAIGLAYVVVQQLERAPPSSSDHAWLMLMMGWMLFYKIVELQSEDLLRCACQPDEYLLRRQRVDSMVGSAQEAVKLALSGFLATAIPPQPELMVQVTDVARSAAEWQQRCSILQLLAAPDPLAVLDDVPPAAGATGPPAEPAPHEHAPPAADAAAEAAAAAAGPPQLGPLGWFAAQLPEQQLPGAIGAAEPVPPAADVAAAPAAPPQLDLPGCMAAPLLPEVGGGAAADAQLLPAPVAAAEAGEMAAAAQAGAVTGPAAELSPAVPPHEPPAEAAGPAPAPTPDPLAGQPAPLPTPSPATSGEAVVVAACQETAGGRQQETEAAAAAEEQQPGAGGAGAARVPERPGEIAALLSPPGRPLAERQPQPQAQPQRPASRSKAAPAAAAPAAKLRLGKLSLGKVSDALAFVRNLPGHSRLPLLEARLADCPPDQPAYAALETIEEEGPLLSAQRVVPQAGQPQAAGAAVEQQPGQPGSCNGGSGSGSGSGSGVQASAAGGRLARINVHALTDQFARLLRLGKTSSKGAAQVQAAPALTTALPIIGNRRVAPSSSRPALPKSRRLQPAEGDDSLAMQAGRTALQQGAASTIPTLAVPTSGLSVLATTRLATTGRRKQELAIDEAANGPIVKPRQLLVRLVERRSSDCLLMEHALLMPKSDLRIGQKQFQLDLYHGFKAVRLAVCSKLKGNRVELQRFATSQGMDAETLAQLGDRMPGLMEFDMAGLTSSAPTAALEAMPTALNCCAPAGAEGPAEEPVGRGGGSGKGLDYCCVSRLAGKDDAEIRAARGALLHWLAENSGRLAVVHEGGNVNVSFRLNKQHHEVGTATGSWHIMAITLPGKK